MLSLFLTPEDVKRVTPKTCLAIRLWLSGCCLLLISLIALGGYTRLSGAGLAISTWQPVLGVIPPLSEQDWQDVYRAYQQTAEYRYKGYERSQFEPLFWIEYSHRMLGRLLGLAFFLPFLFFALSRVFSVQRLMIFGGIFLLGALQGLVGWLMVYSGLNELPQVSPYRLTFHLSLALIIYGLLFLSSLSWFYPEGMARNQRAYPMPLHSRRYQHLVICLLALGVTIVFGALVAGHKAGLIYNSYPLMDGQWLPDEFTDAPLPIGFVSEPALVQWMHRILSLITLVVIMAFVAFVEKDKITPKPILWSARVMSLAVIGQMILGIIMLVSYMPLGLALAHQLHAVVLLSAMLYCFFAFHAYRHAKTLAH